MTYLIIDIETLGLDPAENGMVTCICVLNTFNDEKKTFQVKEDFNEKRMLEDFWKYIEGIKYPSLVGFNSSKFDIPYLIHRSIVRNVFIPKFFQLDLRLTVNSFFISYESKVTGKLSYWATVLGIPIKTSNGAQMVTLFTEGKYDEIKEHCLEDIGVTHALFQRCWNVGLINEKGEKFPRYANGN